TWELEYSLVDNDSGVIHIGPLTVEGKMAGVNHNVEVYYLGTAPRRDFNVQYDVLVGLYDALEIRAYFDQETGQLMVLEMFPESDTDPCEIEFSEYRETDGYTLPHRMVIRYGDDPFDILTVKKWNVHPTGEGA
ncbi:degP_3, partial [Symbiodinium sp. CCMP2456]